eukprot:81631_1
MHSTHTMQIGSLSTILLTISLLITPINCQYLITADDSYCLTIGTSVLTNNTQLFWSNISYLSGYNCVNWVLENFNHKTQSTYNGKVYVSDTGPNMYWNQTMYVHDTDFRFNLMQSPQPLSLGQRAQAVGYAPTKNMIELLGGHPNGTLHAEYSINSTKFHEIGAICRTYHRSYGQAYTQIGDVIYSGYKAKFDVVTELYSITQNNGEWRYGCLAAIDPIHIFFVGGNSTPATATNVYNIVNDTFAAGPSMNEVHRYGTCHIVNHYLYVIGGDSKRSIEKLYVDISNILGYSFHYLDQSLIASGRSARSEVIGNNIFIQTSGSDSIQVLDTTQDTISIISNFGTKAYQPGSIVVHNIWYLFGIDDLVYYDFTADTDVNIADVNIANGMDEFEFDLRRHTLTNRKYGSDSIHCALGMSANDNSFLLGDDTTIRGYAARFDCSDSGSVMSSSIGITYPTIAPTSDPTEPTLSPTQTTSAPTQTSLSPTKCIENADLFTNDGVDERNLTLAVMNLKFTNPVAENKRDIVSTVHGKRKQQIRMKDDVIQELQCTNVVSCSESPEISFTNNTICNLLCNDTLSCATSTIDILECDDAHIICNGDESCKASDINIKNSNGKPSPSTIIIECGLKHSCTDLTVHINGATAHTKVSCYEANSCDNLDVSVEDYEHSILAMHSHSINVTFDNGIGLRDRDRNEYVECNTANRYIPYESTLGTAQIDRLILDEYENNVFPCDGIVIGCLYDVETVLHQGTCEMSYHTKYSIDGSWTESDCYWLPVKDIIDISCIGNCIASPTFNPTNAPTTAPTSTPTLEPTTDPTRGPTNDPSMDPAADPTSDPTHGPTRHPTVRSTTEPTTYPTFNPSAIPSNSPTDKPSIAPLSRPTIAPTVSPSYSPSSAPNRSPTSNPTMTPTIVPTGGPTHYPTRHPTVKPTPDPTVTPTIYPTANPTKDPTFDPTRNPTRHPTLNPTFDPTGVTKHPRVTASPSDMMMIPTTKYPTVNPTKYVTADPTNYPTIDPTIDLTYDPTKDQTIDPTYNPTIDSTSDPLTDQTNDPSTNPTTQPTIGAAFQSTFVPTDKGAKRNTINIIIDQWGPWLWAAVGLIVCIIGAVVIVMVHKLCKTKWIDTAQLPDTEHSDEPILDSSDRRTSELIDRWVSETAEELGEHAECETSDHEIDEIWNGMGETELQERAPLCDTTEFQYFHKDGELP